MQGVGVYIFPSLLQAARKPFFSYRHSFAAALSIHPKPLHYAGLYNSWAYTSTNLTRCLYTASCKGGALPSLYSGFDACRQSEMFIKINNKSGFHSAAVHLNNAHIPEVPVHPNASTPASSTNNNMQQSFKNTKEENKQQTEDPFAEAHR